MSENRRTESLHQRPHQQVQNGPGVRVVLWKITLFLLPDGEENDIVRKPHLKNPKIKK